MQQTVRAIRSRNENLICGPVSSPPPEVETGCLRRQPRAEMSHRNDRRPLGSQPAGDGIRKAAECALESGHILRLLC